ncbi:MAG: NAD(P)H-binding protein, partial [Rhizobiales bacterium]|nr:NAD(P)H-binding protein [Hyphomicrobiales bacterium]
MRVLVIGASGLIGSAVTVRLIQKDCDVIAVARRTGQQARRIPAAHWIALDIAAVRRPEDWLPYLDGVGAVVNCAGVLQDSPRDSTRGVHVEGISALFAACARVGIRRVVHFSAIGVDHETPTAFSRTKLEGDRALMRLDLDWVILRPSVVVGPAAYGASALFRGLAALPVLPVMPETGLLQVVQLEEVVETVVLAITSQIPPRVALDLAGPERLSLVEIVRHYRSWLGWAEPRILRLPRPASILLYRLGDFAGWLGWRPPIRSTAEREIARGATGDASVWIGVTGITPRSLADALAARPASVQERWFSGL